MNNIIRIDEEEKKIGTKAKYVTNGISIIIQGENNRIIIGKSCRIGALKIAIVGDSNSIIIDDKCSITEATVLMSTPANYRTLKIGRNTYIGRGTCFVLSSHKNTLEVGKDCMFSNDIILRTEDGHPIFDITSKELLNKGGKIVIGNHCWLGERCYITKNVILADNIIVGTCALVTKSFEENYIAIGGNPAKILKRNVSWNNNNIHDYQK